MIFSQLLRERPGAGVFKQAAAFLACLLALAAPGVAAANYHTRLLTPAELRQAEAQTVALAGSHHAEYDRRQSFALEVNGRPALEMLAIRYPAPPPGNSYRCAIAFLPKDGQPYLVSTIGTGEREAVSCTGLAAAGFLEGSPMPAIALVYRAQSPNFAVSTPLLLRWNAGRYAIDEKLSRALDDRQGTETIAGIRQALREMH